MRVETIRNQKFGRLDSKAFNSQIPSSCELLQSRRRIVQMKKPKATPHFSAGDFSSAIQHFTDAISLSPSNHVLFSNRSAAHASLSNFAQALSDAEQTVHLKPDWPKGYSRLGSAHLGLKNVQQAITAYKKGLQIDPDNEALKSGLRDAEAAQSRPKPRPGPASPFGDIFSGAEMWSKLTADPGTRPFLDQPDFVRIMKEIQRNPNSLNMYLQDQRVMKALGTLLGVNLNAGPASGGEGESSERGRGGEEESVKAPEPVPETELEPEVVDVPDEEKEKKERKVKAVKEKEAGNAAYKKKDFETAIQKYTEAIELDDEDISFLTNRAAVYLEMGKV